MGLSDLFKAKQYKTEMELLQEQNQKLSKLLTPEMQEASKQQEFIYSLQVEENKLKEAISAMRKQIETLDDEIAEKRKSVIFLDDEVLYQNFGVYSPIYALNNSEEYKDKLILIREKQKQLIKSDKACYYPSNMQLDGSLSKGQKMIKDNVKQILRSFNNECDSVIDKVKFNNIEQIRKKIQKSFDDLNKMNSSLSIRIYSDYLSLKLQELNLCHEYAIKKQEEKEEQKLIREQLKEEAKLAKELEEARKVIAKEQTHYKNALEQLEKQLTSVGEAEKDDILKKKDEILSKLDEIDKSIKDIDYREANKRAGYVYIISNIGSFGENVFKIGMTRRLEPTERVDELGDASVPFNFDIHALIFSDDAPSLENALHKAFEHKKLNMVNQRREFFNVSLNEIMEVVKANFDKTVEFKRVPEAGQYRESEMLRKIEI